MVGVQLLVDGWVVLQDLTNKLLNDLSPSQNVDSHVIEHRVVPSQNHQYERLRGLRVTVKVTSGWQFEG